MAAIAVIPATAAATVTAYQISTGGHEVDVVLSDSTGSTDFLASHETTYRPDGGNTSRSTGTTVRPDGGNTARITGMTPRPFSGNTARP
jgi:hypothetical protein